MLKKNILQNNITIRRYQPSDKNEVMDLHVLALKQTDSYFGGGVAEDDLQDIEKSYLQNGGEFLVGIFENRIIAMAGFRRKSNDTTEIKRMRVHPDFQKKGLGQTLYDMLEIEIKEKSYKTIVLDTTINQIAAQSFYLKNGFMEMRRDKEVWPIETIFYQKKL